MSHLSKYSISAGVRSIDRTGFVGFCSICFVVLLLTLCNTANAAEKGISRVPTDVPDELGKRHAIVIGINRYDHLAQLQYAEEDARKLADYFKSQDYDVHEFIGYRATKERILTAIDELSAFLETEQEPHGTLVVTFSGHGANDGEENFLSTPESKLDEYGDSWIAMSEIATRLQEINVRQRLMFIDACRDNPQSPTRSAGSSQTFLTDDEGEGLAILYSTGKGTVSWEDPQLGRGVFSYFLSEGLSGEAADESGQIQFDRLRDYVTYQVKHYVYQKFRKRQIPYVGGERTGKFVIGSVDQSLASLSSGAGDTPVRSIRINPVASTGILPDSASSSPFEFINAASDVAGIRSIVCSENNDEEANRLKKEATAVFNGKYEYQGKKDQEKGWQLYVQAIRLCNTSALVEISQTLLRQKECELALDYAELAAEKGHATARRLVNQIKRKPDRACNG